MTDMPIVNQVSHGLPVEFQARLGTPSRAAHRECLSVT
jgi:hypothetical protein